jgi:glycosyltransferase involved in cell wall biosynthesis
MKRILHISTIDRGGAANVCINLHSKLMKKGIQSNIITLKKTMDCKHIEQYYDHRPQNFITRKFYHYQSYLYPFIFNKLLKDQPKEHEVFTFPYSFFNLTKHPLYQKADLLHFHYVPYLLDWKKFFSRNTKPIVWTMHDMSTFTGGCHHSEECRKYGEDCSECPQLKDTYIPEHAFKMLKLKKRTLSGNVVYITPSRWLGSQALESTLLKGENIKYIPNAINLDAFKKYDKQALRKGRGLALDKKIVLFIVDDFSRKNKGYDLLLSSIKKLDDQDDIIFIFVGDNLDGAPQIKNFKYYPFVESSIELAKIYSLSDITVIPSRYETFSLIAAESMSCGTPVVAFNAAGQKERIIHEVDGYLAEPYSADSFARGITYCLDSINHGRLSKNCEQKARNEYGLDVMFQAYYEVYEEMLLY